MADGTEGSPGAARAHEGLLPAERTGRSRERVTLIIGGLVAVLALAATGLLAHGAPSRPVSALTQTRRPATPSPASLAASRGLGADQRAFWIAHSRSRLLAVNRSQRMRASFAPGGVTVSVPGGDVGLSLRAVGRGATLTTASRVKPAARANRVTYSRGGLLEWYANGPLGLEQGVTLRAPPAARSLGGLSLSYTLTGAAARLSQGQLTFTGRDGTPLLRYADLTATDARGRTLPSSLQLDGRRLLLHVDDAGARYPITVDPLMQVATLTASDSTQGGQFGYSVAVSGSTAIVGDPSAGPVTNFQGAGAAYVFTEPASGWANATQTATLTGTPPSGMTTQTFGSGVAVSGDTAYIVSNEVNSTTDQGVVFVFTDTGSGWTQTATLAPSTPTPLVTLGPAAITISGSTLFVGAPEAGSGGEGVVYVFSELSGGWTAGQHESAALTPSDGGFDFLGASLSLSADGQTLAVGAPFTGASFQGAVYIFTKSGSAWTSETQQAVLSATAGSDSDGAQLGDSVVIDGNTILAGAPMETVGSTTSAGVVFVYARSGSTWADATPTATLSSVNPASGDLFGLQMALGQYPTTSASRRAAQPSDETVFVGTGDGTGVYRFAEPATGWQSTSGAAVLGLQSASPFSLTLDGGYLLEGADHSVYQPKPETVEDGSVNVFDAAGPTATAVSCNPNPVAVATATTCTATVTDESSTPSPPTDTVTFTSSDAGGAFSGSPCTLAPTSGTTSACAVTYTPSAAGAPTITAAYAGDVSHGPSSATTSLTVTGGGGGGAGGGGGGGSAGVPVNTAPPSITGSPLPSDRLSCSAGTWTNSPTSFKYQWDRHGVPISDATASTYTVQILDESSTLTCVVTAANAAGAGAPATSPGVLVAVKGTLNCPKPSGSIHAQKLGPLGLGITRAKARKILHRFNVTSNGFDNFCLYAGWGIRVGFPSTKLLKSVTKKQRNRLKATIVFALTANPFYELHGIKPGIPIATATRKLKFGKRFKVGVNDWYLATGKGATSVLKVRFATVQEVGIASAALTRGRTAQKRFLTSFKSG